jgi:murein DD-endopeptidase MepM/ murein hydrolase activator NlpD
MLKNFHQKTLKFIDHFSSKSLFGGTSIVLSLLIIGTIIIGTIEITNKSNQSSNKTNFFDKLNYKLADLIENPYREIRHTVKNNETLEQIFKAQDLDREEVNTILSKLNKNKLDKIFPNREIKIITKKLSDNENSLVFVKIPVTDTKFIEITKKNKEFNFAEKSIKLFPKSHYIFGTINYSLYSAAVKAGIEPSVIVEFARIFGFEVDFQRDIRKNDTFEIYYEKMLDERKNIIETGNIFYVSLNVNGKKLILYNFNDGSGNEFYESNGKSIIRALMKTPINGARLSSSFGLRKHPILGYNLVHQGTDFAAKTGTPVMASGNGLVEFAGTNGAYGKYIRIRHNSTYKTAYAHLNGYAKGVRKGQRVSQGQIIGYVGSTGRSTGPHLHYEVLVNGKRVNSQKLKLPSGKNLSKDKMSAFTQLVDKINQEIESLK